MIKVTRKVLTSSLVILTALGLTGCVNNSAAAPTTKATTSTKVVKQSSHKATPKVSEHSISSTNTVDNTNDTTDTNNISAPNSYTTNPVSQSNNSSRIDSQATSQTANFSTTSSTDDDQQILTSFVKNSSVQQDGNHYYVSKNTDNNNYQIEVRNNKGGDPNVAHLTGIYQYDPATNQIHKMNPLTGNYTD